MSKRNILLAKKHGAVVVPFKDLHVSHQVAIAHYMAIDGEAWSVMGNLEKDFEKIRPGNYSNTAKWEKFQKEIIRLLTLSIGEYIKKYGKVKFGMVNLPIKVAKELSFKKCNVYDDDGNRDGFSSFDEYHKWYIENGGIPHHSKANPFPCILSSFNDELFQDGWHRFHRYCQLGMKFIPCVYFA